MAKSSSTNSRMESDDDDEAPEALGGEAVDASAGVSISCAKQRTVRPKALPYPTTVNDIGSYGIRSGFSKIPLHWLLLALGIQNLKNSLSCTLHSE